MPSNATNSFIVSPLGSCYSFKFQAIGTYIRLSLIKGVREDTRINRAQIAVREEGIPHAFFDIGLPDRRKDKRQKDWEAAHISAFLKELEEVDKLGHFRRSGRAVLVLTELGLNETIVWVRPFRYDRSRIVPT